MRSSYDDLLFHIAELHKKVRAIRDRGMRNAGLTLNEFLLLELLQTNSDGVTQNAAAAALNADKALISRSVRSLIEKELLISEENPQCRREHLLFLTKKSRAMLPRLEEAHRVGVERFFNAVEEKDLEVFKRTLDQLIQFIDREENGDENGR